MKCACCKKKTVMEFKCSCGHVYCLTCRLPEVHKCTPPPKPVELVKVVADKVEKI